MEEEGGPKAPITRLRRRLSVEQGEDVKSPATPSTPTKKRGRLAAKPQLDLIDENTPVSSPKRATKKALAVAAAENEELPLTPARRSTRIKSNTSILSETTQTLDSPRAKRALRRNSQIGSDNEAPTTPARVTRRTKKDSTSSVENQVDSTSSLPIKQTNNEVTTEETNNDRSNVISSSETANKPKNGSPTPRKSPRLQAKKHRRSSSVISDESIHEKSQEQTEPNVNKSPVVLKGEKQAETESETSQKKDDTSFNKSAVSLTDGKKSETKVSPPIYIIPPSENSKKSNKPKRLNKSTPSLEEKTDIKSKRYRTKSWTTSSTNLTQDSYFCSDNESNKRKMKKSGKDINVKSFNDESASGDLLNVSKDLNKLEQKRLSNNSFNERQDTNLLKKPHSKNVDEEKDNDTNKENTNDNEKNISETEKLFEQAPSANLNPLVFIEDSDSNTDSTSKLVIVEKQSDCEDQCVPVVEHSMKNEIKDNINFSFKKNKETESLSCFNTSVKISNDSCEPMDIDETLPENILKNNISNNKSGFNNSLTQNELSTMKNNSVIDTSHDKSKRKFSLSNTKEDSEKNNKSTLILSELKDLSNVTKSPDSDEKTENNKKSKKKSSISNALSDSQTVAFSKIANDSVEIHNSKSISKNKSLSKSITSTPINKKSIETLGMQTSTPVGLSLKDKLPVEKISIQNTQNGDESESSDGENEESLRSNSLIDDEAEEASDDYESGDSQDEEERQYEKENEIVGKGETLSSGDDYSNDSDYEKDSFIVSSDEEDNELLSGSGDDLSMTNNELSMSKKSKQKYNDRKLKEQKRASREMYAARHGLESNSSKVSKSSNNQSDSSESESEEVLPKKKNNRLRLDSSKLESSVDETDANESIVAKKKKTKRLSESIYNENDVEETEITAISNDTHDSTKDPLCVAVKSEPKTPLKDISCINFTVREELEEVNFNENKTIDQVNETSDPLNVDDEADSTSDDEDKAQIINNYDSVLNQLNKTSKMKVKSHDLSLNVNKKSKAGVNKSLIDNLNLTQPKSSKKQISENLADSPKQAQLKDKTKNKNIEVKINDEESSDSIDMHLLFPSDSEGSTDDVKNLSKNKVNKSEETLISLKRTQGKTNILDVTDNEVEDTANISYKKKNRKSLLNKSKVAENNEGNDAEVSFFVDTVGAHNDSATQMKNQKKCQSSVSNKPTELISTNDSDDDAPLEISFKNEKNKKAIKNIMEEEQINQSNEMQEIVSKTPQSQKKNKKLSTSELADIQDNSVKTPQSQKKNKKLSTSEPVDHQDIPVKTPQSQKKNKKLSTSEPVDHQDIPVKTPQSQKKNKKLSLSESVHIQDNSMKTPQSQKKNKKLSMSEPVDIQDNSVKTPQSQKKNKKLSMSEPVDIQDNSVETPQSQKKNKKLSTSEPVDHQDIPVKTPQSQKKNKKLSLSEPVDIQDNSVETPQSQKKNKKLSTSEPVDHQDIPVKTPQSQKKNKKLSLSEPVDIQDNSMKTPQSQKKNKNLSMSEPVNIQDNSVKTPQSQKKNKKLSTSEPVDIQDNSMKIPQSQKKNKKLSLSEPVDHQDISVKTPQSQKKNKAASKSESTKSRQALTTSSLDQNSETRVADADFENKDKKKSKKRKRNTNPEVNDVVSSEEATDASLAHHKNKKLKTSNKEEVSSIVFGQNRIAHQEDTLKLKKSKDVNNDKKSIVKEEVSKDLIGKKRKYNSDDKEEKALKIPKEHYLDTVHVHRLPNTFLKQLDDKPSENLLKMKKAKVVATANFIVEEPTRRKNKPSNYLEESVYLNDDNLPIKKSKGKLTNPKVLPFVPTATLSAKGFTTTFKVNVIPKEVQFVAQSSNVSNFKNKYMFDKKIKRSDTYEMYKKQRNIKLSKF